MKKILISFIAVAFYLISCKNDIDVTADWKETPVIYGLLTLDSSNQYIKLYKAYLDANTSAIKIAQIPDSFYYYDDIELYVEKKSNGQRINTTKIDGNTIGLSMDSGTFATSPNILYKFTETLNPNETYIIRFNNNRTGKSASAETSIVNDFTINPPIEGYDFNFTSQSPINVQWKTAKNGKVYDLVFRFKYQEWNVNNPGDIVEKTIEWKLGSQIVSNGIVGGEQLSVRIVPETFYTTLKSQLEENSLLRRRSINRPIELIFYVGGEELYNFIRVNQAQTGITSLQTLPEYTNIDGGLGIFSSRKYKIRGDLGLTNISLDSLSCGSVTKNLNFVNRNCN